MTRAKLFNASNRKAHFIFTGIISSIQKIYYLKLYPILNNTGWLTGLCCRYSISYNNCTLVPLKNLVFIFIFLVMPNQARLLPVIIIFQLCDIFKLCIIVHLKATGYKKLLFQFPVYKTS